MGSSTLNLAEAIAAEPSFLPEGWEIKVVGSADDVDTAAPGGPLLSSDERTGEVVAIVGVTGIVDHVNDLIEPGAYADSLKSRRPKVCWAHSWEMPVGKVLQIEEWNPGDPRFAEVKATLDGKPWPAAAGALVARTQFNMKSDRGREAFAAVDFYSETGECEWSIGWKPLPRYTKTRKDGVRVCSKVELYEVSPVLFGAAPLTRTLQVKNLQLADAYLPALEAKAGIAAGGAAPDADEDENELHRLGMAELDWAEVEAAVPGAAPAGDDGHEGDPDVGDRLGLGPAGQDTAVATADGKVLLDAKALIPLTGGTDLADLDFDALMAALPTPQPLPFGGLIKVDTPGDGNRGNAEALIRSYEHGKLAARIRWPEHGAFDRCVAIAGKHMTPDQAKGFCNLRHKGATGVYAGEGKAAYDAASLLSKTWNPLLEVGVDAAHTERKYMGEGRLRGTFEERRNALDRALTELLCPRSETEDSDSGRPVSIERGFVSIEGTWEDRVIATVIRYDGPSDDRNTVEVPYRWDGEHVELGTPRPVELQVSVVPVYGEDDGDLEDALIGPAIVVLGDGANVMKAALARTEVKAGRVLSEANIARVRSALEHLLEVARAAGIDLPGWTGPDPSPADTGETPDTTSPGTGAARATGAPAPVEPAVKALAVDDVRATLAEFGNFLP